MGWVYAIACEGRPLIKIGRTDGNDVEQRLRQLQTGQPDRLSIVWRWETHDSHALERKMHALLDEHHHRGEWFTITPEQAAKAYVQATGDVIIVARVQRWARRKWRAGVRAVRGLCVVVGAAVVASATVGGIVALAT